MPSSRDVSPSCRTSRSCGSSGSSCSPMQRRRALAPRGFDLIVSPKFLTFLILPFYNRPTKVRNIRQQKCYNDLRKRRRSLAWHEQRASRLKNFVLVSARKKSAGRNYSGFGFRTVLSAQNAAVRNTTRFAGGTCSSAAHVDTRPLSRLGQSCIARTCPLTVWFWAIYLCATDKRGISAVQLSRTLGICYESAWYLLHRIRAAMGKRDEKYELSGIVEMGDGYIGRATRNGRRLSAASGGQDEGCGVYSDAAPPLRFFLSTVNGAFFLIRERKRR